MIAFADFSIIAREVMDQERKINIYMEEGMY